eukprot:CAMPEP_0113457112 /NCGR_PEP_ID=MMETSP0014_2-20120614/9238_1 /TAXON_ID=2857 /ORGANISM="Nitzschia sp." /LENGTH=405 /DNA_ID=CAMNT_0000348593 /DNA_START=70 /DNA_END=1287 /DNA_ORIENTATION=+ /assembly_acc=CAM_ASM_000159
MTMSHHIAQKKGFLLAAVVLVALLFFSEQPHVHPSTSWLVGDSDDHESSTWRQHPTEIIGTFPVATAFSPTRTTTVARTKISFQNRLIIKSSPVTSFGLSSWPLLESSLSSFTSDTTTSSSSSTLTPVDDDEDKEKPIKEQFFFIRPALMADIGKASQILTDGFFTLTPWNFLGYFYERLLTFLSLEATCSIIERSNKVTSVFQNLNEISNNGNNPLSGPQQLQQGPMKRKLFVACQKETGVVLGMVEVDARAQREPSSLPNIIRNDETNQILPYMCNLAIDGQYKRRGIAKALVNHCEGQVLQWYDQQPPPPPPFPSQQLQVDGESDNVSTTNFAIPASSSLSTTATSTTTTTSIENSLSLKVRMTNDAAISLYENLGYDRIQQQTDPKTNEVLLLMKKQPLER